MLVSVKAAIKINSLSIQKDFSSSLVICLGAVKYLTNFPSHQTALFSLSATTNS